MRFWIALFLRSAPKYTVNPWRAWMLPRCRISGFSRRCGHTRLGIERTPLVARTSHTTILLIASSRANRYWTSGFGTVPAPTKQPMRQVKNVCGLRGKGGGRLLCPGFRRCRSRNSSREVPKEHARFHSRRRVSPFGCRSMHQGRDLGGISEEARKFYVALGFNPYPGEAMTLVVTLRDLRASL